MNKYLTTSASTVFLSGLLLITGCSSSDDSSGPASLPATVPANAVLIDSSTVAESTTSSAVAVGVAVTSVFGVETATPITAQDIINTILDRVNDKTRNSAAIVNGVAINEQCDIGGTITGDETETSSTYNATINYNECNDGVFTLTGTATINATFTDPAGPYSASITATLTAVTSTMSFGFNGLNFAQNGNDDTGAYTTTMFTFAVNPSTGGGYAVQLTQSLIGNEFVSCELTSGQVLVTGANDSQARATVNPNGSAKIEYHSGDGIFIETDNSPVFCLI